MERITVLKTFEDLLIKHGEFYSSLTKPLKELTDSKEEYKALKEAIWELHKKIGKDTTTEMNIMYGYDGSRYENMNGSEGNVEISSEAKKEGREKGLLISGHNHPDGTSFQSGGDFITLNELNVKYSYTIGADGVFIVKNNNDINSVNENTIKTVYRMYDRESENEFDKKYEKKLKEIYHVFDTTLDEKVEDECMKQINDLYTEYYTSTMQNQIDTLTGIYKNHNVDFNIIHI